MAVGCSFVAGLEPRVVNQIKVREEKFGKSPKTDRELMIIHENCPWVVLRSGIDAPIHDPDRWKVYSRQNTERPDITNDWAKRTVLGGELQNRAGDTTIRPRGIQTLPNDGINKEQSAYRLTEYQGHRPVAGITDFTVTSKDTWGMILEANINIKCWSRDELDMLDRVYFKPGYAAILEWGHTLYFKEDGSECVTPSQMISDEEFFRGGNYLDLDAKVLKKRKEDSNRETLFGYITNFSFSLNKDGSYSCTLKLLSKGSVIRGLRIKGTSLDQNGDDTADRSKEDERLYEDVSVWHRMHQAFIEFANQNIRRETIAAISPASKSDEPRNYRTLPPRKSSGGPGNTDWFNGLEALKAGETKEKLNKKQIREGKGKLFSEASLRGLESFPVVAIPLRIKRNKSEGKQNREFYITLRTLLLLINHFNSENRFGFNLWDKSTYVDPEGSKDCPTVSLNPYIAVKPRQSIEYGKDYTIEKSSTNFYNLILELDGRNEEDSHKIQNIWINFDLFLLDIEHQIVGQVEDYSIFDALQSYLGRIQKAFGNINEFQIVADHKNGDNLFTIIDSKCIVVDSNDDVPEIQVTGLNNTISELTIQSEVSSDLANQMSIAAQAPRTYEDGGDSTDEAMIHWGENCENRWYLPDTSTSESKPSENENSNKDNYEKTKRKWLKKLKKAYTSVRSENLKADSGENQTRETANSEAVLAASEERFSDLQIDGETYFHELAGEEVGGVRKPNLQMGIIPVRVGLTMMGIGNLTIGNVFRIKSAVMPKKYITWAQIITGIEHKVSRAGWITTLKTQYYPLYYGDSSKVPPVNSTDYSKELEPLVTKNAETGVSSGYNIRNTSALENDCNLYIAMTQHTGYYWRENKGTGACARYTAAWARAYACGKNPLYAEPDTSSDFAKDHGGSVPPQGAGGHAYQPGHINEFKTYGYREVDRKTNASLSDIRAMAATCEEGDVLVYRNTDSKGKPIVAGEKAHYHSQFKSDKGWVSDFKHSGCVYSNGTHWTVVRLKAPQKHQDWDCSA